MSTESLNPAAAPTDSQEVAEFKRQLHWAHLKIQVLEERLRLHRIRKYGPGSEKLSNAEVQAESQRGPLPERAKTQNTRKHPGRQFLPATLPRVERVIPCPASAKTVESRWR